MLMHPNSKKVPSVLKSSSFSNVNLEVTTVLGRRPPLSLSLSDSLHEIKSDLSNLH